MPRYTRRTPSVVAAGVLLATVAGPGAVADDREPAPVVVPGGPGEKALVLSPDASRVERVVAESARETAANEADRHFVEMMIPHHYQAIVMSRLAPERAGDDRVAAMADRIRTEQSIEIAALQGWQGREDIPVTDPQESYQRMLDDPEMLEHMGMATRQQIKRLRALDGRAFDRRFIRLMIPHHKGAIRMAEHVAAEGNDLFIRQTAIDMIASQSRQIHQMRQIRNSWG